MLLSQQLLVFTLRLKFNVQTFDGAVYCLIVDQGVNAEHGVAVHGQLLKVVLTFGIGCQDPENQEAFVGIFIVRINLQSPEKQTVGFRFPSTFVTNAAHHDEIRGHVGLNSVEGVDVVGFLAVQEGTVHQSLFQVTTTQVVVEGRYQKLVFRIVVTIDDVPIQGHGAVNLSGGSIEVGFEVQSVKAYFDVTFVGCGLFDEFHGFVKIAFVVEQPGHVRPNGMKELFVMDGIQQGCGTTEMLVGRVVHAKAHVVQAFNVQTDGYQRVSPWHFL